jgi:hypothetical protein
MGCPQRITAESTTGFMTIDFTHPSCMHREVAVEAVTRSGWIRLVLPDGGPGRADRHRDRAPGLRLRQDQAAPPQTIATDTPRAGSRYASRLRMMANATAISAAASRR